MPRTEASTAASGRPALALTRDTDWEDVVRTVNALPLIAQERGRLVATAFARTEIRSLVDIVALAEPRTRSQAHGLHRLHILLSEPFARVMARDDVAGFVQRSLFLEAVERFALAPTFRRVFERSAPELESGYTPQLLE